jgi:uncharacterized protein (DUF952 family)
MLPILHLVSLGDWSNAVTRGEYRPESLDVDGFVHFSTADQVAATAQRFYSEVSDLGLVLVDGEPLDVRFEPASDVVEGGWDELFPHVYGTLDPSEVISVAPYRPEAPWALPREFVGPPSLDGVQFVAADTTGNGQVGESTVFDYREPGDGTISASYRGGAIVDGHLIGWRALDRLRFRYVQLVRGGQVFVGQCQTQIVVDDQGRVELLERWRWLDREGSGTSRMIAQESRR